MSAHRVSESGMKIAVFCPNWLGDMVMATPALRAIRRHFSMAEVVAVVRPYVADVLDGLDLIDRVILHDPSRSRRFEGAKSDVGLAVRLAAAKGTVRPGPHPAQFISQR